MMRKAFCYSGATVAATLRCYSTRYYTDSHEWIHAENGVATLGITKYAQENLGDVVYVSLPQSGDAIKATEVIGEVESVKATSNIYSPIDGTVSAVNETLKDQPGLINESPEEKGWIVKIQYSELPKGLMDEAAYKKFLE